MPRISKEKKLLRGSSGERPNRIHELWKERGWTAKIVAEKVRELARKRGDESRARVHEVTIARLSSGELTLDQAWMELLGDVYDVPAVEIISEPPAAGMRRVRVNVAFEAGIFAACATLPEEERYDVLVPDDEALRSADLYGGELRGDEMNERYPSGTLLILSVLSHRPGAVEEDRRYHVRVTRRDNMIENSIKTLCRDKADKLWLKPESRDPRLQHWTPLDEPMPNGERVEIVGRVRMTYQREH